MATMYRYQLPVEQTGWTLQSETQTSFTWEYEDERAKLLALYDKGKKQQWDAAVRIDWSLDLDPENPQQIDDRLIPIYGSAVWNRLTDKEKVRLRHHRSEEHTSELQSLAYLVCRLLLEKKKTQRALRASRTHPTNPRRRSQR